MNPISPRPGQRNQEGFLLLGVLFMILLILFALAVAAPKMAEQIRRDKEIETMHRGLQYARAIRMFYGKFGRYPNSIDQLVKTDNQRFLRKRYLDPMTGKDDWRIIHLGEAKVRAVGLFGQSVQSNTITPTGASTGTTSPFGSSSSLGSSSGVGSSSGFGSSGSSLGGSSSSGSGFGSSGSGLGSTSSSTFGGNSGSASGNSGSSTSTTGGIDSGTASGSTFGSTPIGGTTTTGQSSGAFGSPGVTVGGAPIVGVGLLSKKESIKVYKKQTHYNQWEFVFDYTQNALDATSGAATNVNGATNGSGTNGASGSGFSNSSGFGSNNGSGFGSSSGSGSGSSNGSDNGSGFGGTPSNPVSPTSPVNNSPQ